METEQLYANGNPVCPTTNYENDNAEQRIRNAEILLDEIAERVATRLLEKTDIAEWAKQARKPSYTASEVGADASGSAQRALLDAKEYSDSTYQQATGYTDTAIARLVGSAPSTLDTLGEIAAAMEDNESVVLALEAAIGNKADEKEYQAHAGNRTMHVTASEREKWNEAADRIPSAPEDIGALPSGASAVSADKWKTPRNINGMNVDGSGNRTNYGTCSTAAATAAKVVSCNGFGLVTGAEITVKFTVTNTAANPTLNVNSTGAKPVWYRGAAIAAGYLAANRTYIFRYNGTQYELVGDIDTNEKYSAMTGATESAGGKAGLVPAPAKGAQGKYLRGDGTWVAPATTLAGTEQGIPLDQTMGKILNDKVSEIISNLQSLSTAEVITMTANASWVKKGDVLCFKIANRCFFQFIEVEFAKESANTEYKKTLFWTLGKSVGYEKVFLLYPIDGGQPIRLLCSGNKIYGHYSGAYLNMDYFGLLVM
ncbi:MAG: hypothetical protein K2O16_03005 [Lachnospiraceae bacterium]|nr:hypothetical protein [Lachnospiraceae bacterium]